MKKTSFAKMRMRRPDAKLKLAPFSSNASSTNSRFSSTPKSWDMPPDTAFSSELRLAAIVNQKFSSDKR